MYVDIAFIRTKNKTYKRVLLRTSYREGKKVKHKTVANLSGRSEEEIEAIRFALKNKDNIREILEEGIPSQWEQGLAIGSTYVLNNIAERIGVSAVLGRSRSAKLALWQIFARIIAQGSRLSAVRLASMHAVCDILSLETFTEDDLYHNLDWLSARQQEIEKRLFAQNHSKINLFLYDVTSSYAEGDQNAYTDYGYNRDKKVGKKQIVIGLLTDVKGDPISIQVFEGNTADGTTFVEQVHKVREQFGVEYVVWVGDRGMIKQPQIDALPTGCCYVITITKPQIMKLLRRGIFSIQNFSNQLVEIKDNQLRYILRRNPVRAQEMASNRQEKLKFLQKLVTERNQYLMKHPKAIVEKAVELIKSHAKKLKIASWVKIDCAKRNIRCTINNGLLSKEMELDGCYVVKTNVSEKTEAGKIHERYKDLSKVEWAFRTMKTTCLEMRPYYVRKKTRTEGHIFVVMLAYKFIRYLQDAWRPFNLTAEEGIVILSGIHGLIRKEDRCCQHIPRPNQQTQKLLAALDIELPEMLPVMGVKVATRKKLTRKA